MSFSEFTTMDRGLGGEGDDESDFGEFSSASPKSVGPTTENYLTTTNPSTSSTSNVCGQPAHFGNVFGVKLHDEVTQRGPNGYIIGQKFFPQNDRKDMETAEYFLPDSQPKISNLSTGNVHQTVSGTCGCKSSLSRAKLCGTRTESEISDSLLTSCTDPSGSVALQNCHSWSAGNGKLSPTCPDASSSKRVDGLSVLSGSKVIRSVQSGLGEVELVCDLTGSVGWHDSSSSSNAESSSSASAQINSENNWTYAGGISETCEFDDFSSMLHVDDFQDQTKPAGNKNHSWAPFGDVGVAADSNDCWLAFEDRDVETSTMDHPKASQTVDCCPVIMLPNAGASDDDFSQSRVDKKKSVFDFLQSAFPSSADSSSCGEERSAIAGASCGREIFRPNLLDLIGEHSKEIDLAGDRKRSSAINARPSSSAAVWNSLKVMEDTAALKFHWNGSRSNRLLLKSVAVESPTKLNTRRIQKLPAARTVQEIQGFRGSGGARVSCRQPCESSFPQTVLSVTQLRM